MIVVVDGGSCIRKHRRKLLHPFMNVFQFLLLGIEIVARLGDEWFMFVFIWMFISHLSAREETKHGDWSWRDEDDDGDG